MEFAYLMPYQLVCGIWEEANFLVLRLGVENSHQPTHAPFAETPLLASPTPTCTAAQINTQGLQLSVCAAISLPPVSPPPPPLRQMKPPPAGGSGGGTMSDKSNSSSSSQLAPAEGSSTGYDAGGASGTRADKSPLSRSQPDLNRNGTGDSLR